MLAQSILGVPGSLSRYLSSLGELSRELLKSFLPEVRHILATGLASLACQVTAFVLVLGYLRALENGSLILSLDARSSGLLFALVLLASAGFLVGFSVLQYRSRVAILSLTRRYQDQSTAEALRLSSLLPNWFGEDPNTQISSRQLRRLIATDVYQRARLAMVLLLALVPIGRLLVCTLALLVIQFQFSLLILIAAGVPALGLYVVGQRVADTISKREAASDSLFIRQRNLLEFSWESETPLNHEDTDWETTLGDSDSRYRLYFQRMKEKARGNLLMNTAKVLGVLVLLGAMGLSVLADLEANWSFWISYLAVLRYFLDSLASIGQSIVRSSRFLRASRRFAEFMAAARYASKGQIPNAIPCPAEVLLAYQGQGTELEDDD